MVTETLQYYLFKLFKKISEKFANFYLTLTKSALLLTFEGICGIISARENAEIGKKPCTFVLWELLKMYKYRSKQISLTDFNTPVGMKIGMLYRRCLNFQQMSEKLCAQQMR